jgi:hypothetical protein
MIQVSEGALAKAKNERCLEKRDVKSKGRSKQFKKMITSARKKLRAHHSLKSPKRRKRG